jgi:hypothetical protein
MMKLLHFLFAFKLFDKFKLGK